jgi:hypothetical protein
VVTFYNGGATLRTVSWEADQNYVITGVLCNGSVGSVMSFEPDATVAVIGPAGTQNDIEHRVRLVNSVSNLNIPLDKGQIVYVAFTAAKGDLQLFLEDAPAVLAQILS